MWTEDICCENGDCTLAKKLENKNALNIEILLEDVSDLSKLIDLLEDLIEEISKNPEEQQMFLKGVDSIPKCRWAGRGCIDLDNLKNIEYVLIPPRKKRPILWITNKQLKENSKRLDEIIGARSLFGIDRKEVISHISRDLSSEIELDKSKLILAGGDPDEWGYPITTIKDGEEITHEGNFLGIRYYLKQGTGKHTRFLKGKPKDESMRRLPILLRNSMMYNIIIDRDGGVPNPIANNSEIFVDLLKRWGNCDTVNSRLGHKLGKQGYTLNNSTYFTCSFVPDLIIYDKGNYYFTDEELKRVCFRPTVVIRNPFNRKNGGCFKVIHNNEGEAIGLTYVNKVPTLLYLVSSNQVLNFNQDGYILDPLRPAHVKLFQYRRGSLEDQFKALLVQKPIYHKNYMKLLVVPSKRNKYLKKHKDEYWLDLGPLNGIKQHFLSPKYRVQLTKFNLNYNLINIAKVYVTHNNPFYSGVTTPFDLCGYILCTKLYSELRHQYLLPKFISNGRKCGFRVYYWINIGLIRYVNYENIIGISEGYRVNDYTKNPFPLLKNRESQTKSLHRIDVSHIPRNIILFNASDTFILQNLIRDWNNNSDNPDLSEFIRGHNLDYCYISQTMHS